MRNPNDVLAAIEAVIPTEADAPDKIPFRLPEKIRTGDRHLTIFKRCAVSRLKVSRSTPQWLRAPSRIERNAIRRWKRRSLNFNAGGTNRTRRRLVHPVGPAVARTENACSRKQSESARNAKRNILLTSKSADQSSRRMCSRSKNCWRNRTPRRRGPSPTGNRRIAE